MANKTEGRGGVMNGTIDPFARIKVIGVGGGGQNAVNRMIEAGLAGVDFWAMNTDIQVLRTSAAENTLQLGVRLTNGLGAGGDPSVGASSAEESRSEIQKALDGADMVFITAGMGGGTGTGAAPIIAQIAKEMNILTVAVVTKPFRFEGPRRARYAEEGIASLRSYVDTIIIIPNDRLLAVVEKKATLVDAFKEADEVLRQGVAGISDIITIPGLINVDFADVKAVMCDAGTALMGIGFASGDHRAVEAAQAAVNSPLLETEISGARSVLVNVTAGADLTLQEVYEAADLIRDRTDADEANIIFGTVLDPRLEGAVRITVIATGFQQSAGRQAMSLPNSNAAKVETIYSRVEAPAPAPMPQPMPTPPPTPAPAPVPVATVPTTRYEERAPEPQPQPQRQPAVVTTADIDIPTFLRRHERR